MLSRSRVYNGHTTASSMSYFSIGFILASCFRDCADSFLSLGTDLMHLPDLQLASLGKGRAALSHDENHHMFFKTVNMAVSI